jgi:VWFA-related protein
MKPRTLAVGTALLALGVVLSAAQPPTFKGTTRTVAVYATVTDRSGRLVPDLGRDAFEVADEGQRQELTVFANEIQPITVVIMLDRSGSMKPSLELEERAAEAFVARMLPTDKARIGSFANRIEVDPLDFTSNHDELLKILRNNLLETGPTPLWNAVDKAISALSDEQGRRVVLVFTDGMDRPMNFSNHNSSLKDVMKRAERQDVMVYAIGLAGDIGPVGRAPGAGGRSPFGGFGGGAGGMGGREVDRLEKPDEGLAKIAAETGGGYFELTSANDLASTFRRVADELHHQYVLGFAPAKLDGKAHKLDVRVKGTDMSARARKTYVASVDRS